MKGLIHLTRAVALISIISSVSASAQVIEIFCGPELNSNAVAEADLPDPDLTSLSNVSKYKVNKTKFSLLFGEKEVSVPLRPIGGDYQKGIPDDIVKAFVASYFEELDDLDLSKISLDSLDFGWTAVFTKEDLDMGVFEDQYQLYYTFQVPFKEAGEAAPNKEFQGIISLSMYGPRIWGEPPAGYSWVIKNHTTHEVTYSFPDDQKNSHAKCLAKNI